MPAIVAFSASTSRPEFVMRSGHSKPLNTTSNLSYGQRARSRLTSQERRLAAAYEEVFRATANLRPDTRDRTGVCGDWSPKNVVAHLAGWDCEAAERLRSFMAGPTKTVAYDVDAFNAESVAAREHLAWAETLAELGDAHQALRQVVALVSPEHVTADGRFREWLEGRIGDYEHHTAQLQQWFALTVAGSTRPHWSPRHANHDPTIRLRGSEALIRFEQETAEGRA